MSSAYNHKSAYSFDRRVSLKRCSDYDRDRVMRCLEESIDELGGISQFAEPGHHILLKPNLLAPSSKESCVCTHPLVVDSVISILKAHGCRVTVGDSPGFGSAALAARSCGIAEICERQGVPLVTLADPVTHEGQSTLRNKSIPIARLVYEVDGVINMPKLKTHGLTALSAAVKNLYGCIPGLDKSRLHFRFQQIPSFSAFLVDVALAVGSKLSVADGILAMQGKGPRHGSPYRLGALATSPDPFAADLLLSHLVGLDPLSAPVLKAACEMLDVPCNVDDLIISGDSPDDLRVKDFEHTTTYTTSAAHLPQPIARLAETLLVADPVIDADRCTSCGICQKSCPADAISISGAASVDMGKCIRCYCCSELCPSDAVGLRRNWLVDTVSGIRSRLMGRR